MGERKVLNQYIPPDFDPSLIPSTKRDYGALIEVRMMLPFSMKCLRCGNYMYRGKKFNSKKETMQDEAYLGIRLHRFYIKCSVCSNEITFKTDPQNTDYSLESGATRNFELWRENDDITEENKKLRAEEDKQDVMKGLENRTLDSKVEMDILDALDEIKAINQRHERVDTHDVLNKLQFTSSSSSSSSSSSDAMILNKDGLTKEDEELIRSIKFKSSSTSSHPIKSSYAVEDDALMISSSSSSMMNVAKDDSIISKIHDELMKKSSSSSSSSKTSDNMMNNMMIVKKKRKVDDVIVSHDDMKKKKHDDVEDKHDDDNYAKKMNTGSILGNMFNYSDSD